MREIPLFPRPWHQIAQRWGLAPDQLPQAVAYVCAVIRAANGTLELLEVQLGPEGERYVFRFREPALAGQRIVVERPRGWSEEREHLALGDVYVALQRGADDDTHAA
jgi:hypothetical protein